MKNYGLALQKFVEQNPSLNINEKIKHKFPDLYKISDSFWDYNLKFEKSVIWELFAGYQISYLQFIKEDKFILCPVLSVYERAKIFLEKEEYKKCFGASQSVILRLEPDSVSGNIPNFFNIVINIFTSSFQFTSNLSFIEETNFLTDTGISLKVIHGFGASKGGQISDVNIPADLNNIQNFLGCIKNLYSEFHEFINYKYIQYI